MMNFLLLTLPLKTTRHYLYNVDEVQCMYLSFLVLERDFKRANLFEFWMFLKVCFWKQLLGNGIFGTVFVEPKEDEIIFAKKTFILFFCGSRISHSGIIPNQSE